VAEGYKENPGCDLPAWGPLLVQHPLHDGHQARVNVYVLLLLHLLDALLEILVQTASCIKKRTLGCHKSAQLPPLRTHPGCYALTNKRLNVLRLFIHVKSSPSSKGIAECIVKLSKVIKHLEQEGLFKEAVCTMGPSIVDQLKGFGSSHLGGNQSC
jgi:hypothetical protein